MVRIVYEDMMLDGNWGHCQGPFESESVVNDIANELKAMEDAGCYDIPYATAETIDGLKIVTFYNGDCEIRRFTILDDGDIH